MAERVIEKIMFEADAFYLYQKIRGRIDALTVEVDDRVKKDGDKGLSQNDFTDELKYLLERINTKLSWVACDVYTVGISKDEADPEKKVVYFDDAAYKEPVKANPETGSVDLGGFKDSFLWDAISYVMLSYTGEEKEVLNPDNPERLKNGNSGSSISSVQTPYNLMTKISGLYMKLDEDDKYWYLSVTGQQYPGFMPVGFTRADATTADRIYISAYPARTLSGKLRSLPAATPGFTTGKYQQMQESLKSSYTGNDYSFITLPQRTLLTALFLILFKTTDAKKALPRRSPEGTFNVNKGIGWDKSGNPLFLMQANMSIIDTPEYIDGVRLTAGGNLYLKAYPPYEQEETGYTQVPLQNGLTDPGTVTQVALYEQYGAIFPCTTNPSVGESEYFAGRTELKWEAYSNKTIVVKAQSGLFGYDLRDLWNGQSDGTGAFRFSYIPPQNEGDD